jgi:hypothetical protein
VLPPWLGLCALALGQTRGFVENHPSLLTLTHLVNMSEWPRLDDPAWTDHAMSVVADVMVSDEPHKDCPVSPGLFVAKRSGRRCSVVWVANWTLGVKYREDGECYTRAIKEFLTLYERV